MKAKYLFLAAAVLASSAALAEPVMLVVDGDKAKLEIYGRIQLTAEEVTGVSRTYSDFDVNANGVPTINPATGRMYDQPGPQSYNRERNNRSVLGFRGEIKIDDDLKGVWQVESSAAADGGTGLHVPQQTWANRDSGVGLDSKAYGRVIMGSWQTPYTNATMNYDPFYTNTGAYMGIMGNGSGASMTPQTDNVTWDRREHNLIQYWSPEINHIKMRIGYDFQDLKSTQGTSNVPCGYPGGCAPPPLVFSTTNHSSKTPYLVSYDAVYDDNQLNVAFGYELHHNFQDETGSDYAMKLGAAYWLGGDANTSGATRIAVLAQHFQYHVGDPIYAANNIGDLKQNQIYLSVVNQMTDKDKFKFSYAKGGEVTGTPGVYIGYLMVGPQSASSILSLGPEHQFNKNFAVFAYYSKVFNESNAFMDFPLNDVAPAMGVSPSLLAAGMRITW